MNMHILPKPLHEYACNLQVSLMDQMVKEPACNAEDPGSIPGSGRPLEKGMATHSSILAWRISWTVGTGGLPSMGSQTVEHD